MTKKKILSIFLVFLFFVGTAGAPVFAADSVARKTERNMQDADKVKISKDQALKVAADTVEKFFEMKIDQKKFDTNIELESDFYLSQDYAWDIRWDMDNDEESINVHVMLDANTGKVLRVHKYEYDFDEDEPEIASITEAQAKKIADIFIKKVNPKEFEQIEYNDKQWGLYHRNYRSKDYEFIYTRKINGIPFDRNQISVEIDGVTGKVTSYSYQWNDDVDAPDTEGALSKEKAQELFRNEVEMRLVYMPVRDKYTDETKLVKLVYAPEFKNGIWLDAKQGEMLDWRGKDKEDKKEKDIDPAEKEKLIKQAKLPKTRTKEIEHDEAVQVIEKLLKEFVGEGYEIEDLRYIDEEGEEKAWRAHFHKQDGDKRFEDDGRISIDAFTEQLISIRRYYDYDDEEDFEPKLTWDKAYEQAIQVIAKYFPEKLKQIETKQVQYDSNSKQRMLYFHFPRMINGIEYMYNDITISFDVKTGQIEDLSLEWNNDIQVPETNKKISKEEAKKYFFEKNQPELIYKMIELDKEQKEESKEIKLVYQLKSQKNYYAARQLDAVTGKFIDYRGQEVQEKKSELEEKIKGHWAEKELSILTSQGIINEETFEVDKNITNIEFIKMLANAEGYEPYMIRDMGDLKFTNTKKDDPNYGYLKMAVKYRFIEDKKEAFNFDKNVTREEAAQLIIKLVGYEELAQKSKIFTVDFKDKEEISKDKLGYVAIGKGLGIWGEDGEAFRPKDPATMAEAAVMIYKALGITKNN